MSDVTIILKCSFVQAEHFFEEYDSPDIATSYSAKTLVVDDIGTERVALFSFNFKGGAFGRKKS